MRKTGFYTIQDKFFEDMPDPYLKGNKAGKVMGMLKRGIRFTPTQPDVMAILEKLKERR